MCVCRSSMWCNPWSSCCCRGKMRGLPFLPGCLWLPGAAERSCAGLLSQGCSAFQNSPGDEQQGGQLAAPLGSCKGGSHLRVPPEVPLGHSAVCGAVRPVPAPAAAAGAPPRSSSRALPLRGQDQPPLPCRGAAHLGQVSLSPRGRLVCFHAVPVTVEFTWPGAWPAAPPAFAALPNPEAAENSPHLGGFLTWSALFFFCLRLPTRRILFFFFFFPSSPPTQTFFSAFSRQRLQTLIFKLRD